MILDRKEFWKRWLARKAGGDGLEVKITVEHTHPDSFFTETVEGHVGAVRLDGCPDGTTNVVACVGGDGRHGDGRWVVAFLGSETTSLGLSKHVKITVRLI